MQKVAIIGKKGFVNVFRFMGCEVFLVESKKEVVKLVERLVHDDFVLIFIARSLAEQIPKLMEKYSSGFTPIVSQIPD